MTAGQAVLLRSRIADRRQGVGVIAADRVSSRNLRETGAAMARMIAEVYDALRSAGADEEKARAAATAIAGQWEVWPRFDQIDRRFDQIDKRIDKVEERLDRLEQRVSKIEADVGILKWMVGFALAFQVATLFFIWQLMLRLPT
jgi:tetrahydromethanopterin S-methyltransferase subunit G